MRRGVALSRLVTMIMFAAPGPPYGEQCHVVRHAAPGVPAHVLGEGVEQGRRMREEGAGQPRLPVVGLPLRLPRPGQESIVGSVFEGRYRRAGAARPT